ncbi:MAG: alpha-beta hydrolase superfamily lysophospholipase [Bacteroidia bacterium]|jgi:alpha-beta hydrolase superfamily lysophospholipase
MKNSGKYVIRILLAFLSLIIIGLGLLFFNQEVMIFHPVSLDKDYEFMFKEPYIEAKLKTSDGEVLHGLRFVNEEPTGVVLYLHGNVNAVNTWGDIAKFYTKHNYDIFILDYRGYGKSTGKIKSEEQFTSDAQLAYNYIKDRYNEEDIVVIGYSVGTYVATKMAAVNKPKLLILQSPYFSLTDLMRNLYPFLPTSMLRYKFDTPDIIDDVSCPIHIFHGTEDPLIPFNSSERLHKIAAKNSTLYPLKHQAHGSMNYNKVYHEKLATILAKE